MTRQVILSLSAAVSNVFFRVDFVLVIFSGIRSFHDQKQGHILRSNISKFNLPAADDDDVYAGHMLMDVIAASEFLQVINSLLQFKLIELFQIESGQAACRRCWFNHQQVGNLQLGASSWKSMPLIYDNPGFSF